jgi:hypothetical protein
MHPGWKILRAGKRRGKNSRKNYRSEDRNFERSLQHGLIAVPSRPAGKDYHKADLAPAA